MTDERGGIKWAADTTGGVMPIPKNAPDGGVAASVDEGLVLRKRPSASPGERPRVAFVEDG